MDEEVRIKSGQVESIASLFSPVQDHKQQVTIAKMILPGVKQNNLKARKKLVFDDQPQEQILKDVKVSLEADKVVVNYKLGDESITQTRKK